jgi:hypothetical protein
MRWAKVIQPRLLGAVGAVMLGLGVFAPIITIPIVGTLNYFANGRGDGVVLLLLAIISGLLITANRLHWLFTTGCVSLMFLIAAFLNLDARLTETRTELSRDLRDNPFGGLAETAFAGVQIQWGWAVLVVGAGLLVAAALMRPLGVKRRCPFCAEEIQHDAVVCKHCKRDLDAATPSVAVTSQMRRLPASVLVVTLLLTVVGGGIVYFSEWIELAAEVWF